MFRGLLEVMVQMVVKVRRENPEHKEIREPVVLKDRKVR